MNTAAANALPSNSRTVADRPPAPTAAMVLEQRARMERELASLAAKVGEVAYLAATNGKSGAALLAELHGKIQAAQFALDCNAAAHAHAIEIDKAAVADWWAQVHALPADEAIAGISRTECCRRCSEAAACILSSGAECIHPLKAGPNLNPRHQNNPDVRRLQRAAAEKLGAWR